MLWSRWPSGATGFVATTSLRGYLQTRLDNQLKSSVNSPVVDRLRGGGAAGPRRPASRRRLGSGPPRSRRRTTSGLLDAQGNFGRVLAQPGYSTSPKLPKVTVAQANARSGASRSRCPAERRALARHCRSVGRQLGGSIAVATSLDDVRNTVNRLSLLEVIIGAVALVLLGGIGYIVVRNSLRPLVEVEETAEAIAAGDLTRRVPDLSPRTEVGRLSRA